MNTQTTTYNLSLSAEQFDALHELLDETIADYSSDLDLDLVDLNDIEIYQILLQMNRFREGESNNNSGKVYPQVDDVPEQVYNDWLYNKEAN
mgnify:FL=1